MHDPDDQVPNRVVIKSFGELLGSIPWMLGFSPTESLILIAHHRIDSLGPTTRVDLPAPAELPVVVDWLRQQIARLDAVSVTAIVVDYQGTEDVLPHRALVNSLDALLHQAHTSLHALWTPSTNPGSPYRCYSTCACAGRIPSAEQSPVTTALIVRGATVANSRDDLVATLRPDPPGQLQRRAALLRARRHTTKSPDTTTSGYQLLRDTIASVVDRPTMPILDDTDIVEMAAALTDPAVAGRCMAIIAAADTPAPGFFSHDNPGIYTKDPLADPLLTHPNLGTAIERVWTLLTRAVPGPERAEPATLLTIQAYLRGDATLAGIANEIALNANDTHPLARTLNVAIHNGVAPEIIRGLLQEILP